MNGKGSDPGGASISVRMDRVRGAGSFEGIDGPVEVVGYVDLFGALVDRDAEREAKAACWGEGFAEQMGLRGLGRAHPEAGSRERGEEGEARDASTAPGRLPLL